MISNPKNSLGASRGANLVKERFFRDTLYNKSRKIPVFYFQKSRYRYLSSIPVHRYFPVYRRGLVTDTGQECGDQHRVGGRHPQEGRVQAAGDQEGGDGGGVE